MKIAKQSDIPKHYTGVIELQPSNNSTGQYWRLWEYYINGTASNRVLYWIKGDDSGWYTNGREIAYSEISKLYPLEVEHIMNYIYGE